MVHRVLVVEDHEEVRSAIASMLTAEGFDVVGEARDGCEAVELVRLERPDVVLLDIRLPGPDGFEVARELAGIDPPPVVVLVSSHEARVYDSQIARSSAGVHPQERAVGCHAAARPGRSGPVRPIVGVVALLSVALGVASEAAGYGWDDPSNHGVAERLHNAERTVVAHIARAFQKLGLVDEADARRRVLATLLYLRSDHGAGTDPSAH